MRAFLKRIERRGQSMAEYALVLAAVGVATFATYKAMGTTIVAVLNTLIGDL